MTPTTAQPTEGDLAKPSRVVSAAAPGDEYDYEYFYEEVVVNVPPCDAPALPPSLLCKTCQWLGLSGGGQFCGVAAPSIDALRTDVLGTIATIGAAKRQRARSRLRPAVIVSSLNITRVYPPSARALPKSDLVRIARGPCKYVGLGADSTGSDNDDDDVDILSGDDDDATALESLQQSWVVSCGAAATAATDAYVTGTFGQKMVVADPAMPASITAAVFGPRCPQLLRPATFALVDSSHVPPRPAPPPRHSRPSPVVAQPVSQPASQPAAHPTVTSQVQDASLSHSSRPQVLTKAAIASRKRTRDEADVSTRPDKRQRPLAEPPRPALSGQPTSSIQPQPASLPMPQSAGELMLQKYQRIVGVVYPAAIRAVLPKNDADAVMTKVNSHASLLRYQQRDCNQHPPISWQLAFLRGLAKYIEYQAIPSHATLLQRQDIHLRFLELV